MLTTGQRHHSEYEAGERERRAWQLVAMHVPVRCVQPSRTAQLFSAGIPLTSSTTSRIDASMPSAVQQYVTPLQNTMESVAGTVGQTVLPTIDLLRIGLLF